MITMKTVQTLSTMRLKQKHPSTLTQLSWENIVIPIIIEFAFPTYQHSDSLNMRIIEKYLKQEVLALGGPLGPLDLVLSDPCKGY